MSTDVFIVLSIATQRSFSREAAASILKHRGEDAINCYCKLIALTERNERFEFYSPQSQFPCKEHYKFIQHLKVCNVAWVVFIFAGN